MARILIVDDEPKLGRVLVEMLEGAGHDVARAGGGREALARLQEKPVDVVITDLRMPDVDGMAVLKAVKTATPNTDVMMMTAHATAQNAVEAMTQGAVDYLIKPFAMEEFRLRVGRVVERRELSRRADTLAKHVAAREGFASIVATTPAMRAVIEQARRVAATGETVLLLGESGTGKSVLARAIHHASPRASMPLVEVLGVGLTDVALGTHAEAARGGTLVLDEIGELPAESQARLLRVLQDGSTRVVASTNRDLKAEVAAGRFREDLYYRLAVVPLEVPALRDRAGDIPGIVRARLAARGAAEDRISPAALDAIAAHSWPGNVRELDNALARALVIAGSEPITVEHLPALSAAKATPDIDDLLVVGFSIDDHERRLIQGALVKAGGNKTRAAKLLGITRRRLYSRLDSIAHGRLEPPGNDEPDEP